VATEYGDAEQPATSGDNCVAERPDTDDSPRYGVVRGPRGRYHVHDSERRKDVATCTRETQAHALAEGLNEGSLLVNAHSKIVPAVKAATR
jgi:hypothetical protein